MGDNLAEHVAKLRHELNEITRVYVERKSDEMTLIMVQLEAMKAEIDSLESFVIRRHDKRCLGVLRKKMSQHLSRSETKTLIHDYGISDFDYDYEGSTLSGLHAELIGFCERRDILPDLLIALREHRPRVQWPDC